MSFRSTLKMSSTVLSNLHLNEVIKEQTGVGKGQGGEEVEDLGWKGFISRSYTHTHTIKKKH